MRREHARADFRMWAEAYWDLEPRLPSRGFDACYDKRLYDRLVHHAPVHEVRAHLAAPIDDQHHSVRFVENHDEPRAAGFADAGPPRRGPHRRAHRARRCAGARGRAGSPASARAGHAPGRRPHEDADPSILDPAYRLLDLMAKGLRDGEWSLGGVHGWPDNQRADRLLSWSWTSPDQRHRGRQPQR